MNGWCSSDHDGTDLCDLTLGGGFRLPTPEEYLEYAARLDSMSEEIYRYMNFDKMPAFVESAKRSQEVVLKLAM